MNQTTTFPHAGSASDRLSGQTRNTTRPSALRSGSPAGAGSAAAGSHLTHAEAVQSRFALTVTARLTEGSRTLAPEIGERLRFAREQALERARASRSAVMISSPAMNTRGAGALGRNGDARRGDVGRAGGRWWFKLASVLPAFALVGGLFLIERWQDNAQLSVAAEIDAALLSDALPPTAYSDAGFGEFIKNPGR